MEQLSIGERVVLRHPVYTRLNGLTGTVLMRNGEHYKVMLVSGERVTLHRMHLVTKQYHDTVNDKVSLQYLYETCDKFLPKNTIVEPIGE